MGQEGETPIVEATGARHGMSLISAITSRGHMRFMIVGKGGVNADVFIEFLKRLTAGAKRMIFLIVDRGRADIAKKTKTLVESLKGVLKLLDLPPCSPDRNPDGLAWKHLKAEHGRAHDGDEQGRLQNQGPLVNAAVAENNPAKIRSFYQKPYSPICRVNVEMPGCRRPR